MNERRRFLKAGLASAAAIAVPAGVAGCTRAGEAGAGANAAAGAVAIANAGDALLPAARPRIVSTWDFGVGASQAAWKALQAGGSALDAVEAGARWAEADLCNASVGHCGNPDRDGVLTLDASIMDGDGRCGAVAAIEDIAHPVSVARAVMEKTPHVLLAGAGAQQFAVEQGFAKTRLLTPEAEQRWREWLQTSEYAPRANSELDKLPGNKQNHDTLGILALGADGRLAGACTTSGMAWKLHGRVGDSPLIGDGLYVDNEVGAATATGVGEEMIRNAASFLVVELMRQGRSPLEACREAIARVVRKRPESSRGWQVAFLAMNKDGEAAGFALYKGFVYAVCDTRRQDALLAAGSVYATTAE